MSAEDRKWKCSEPAETVLKRPLDESAETEERGRHLLHTGRADLHQTSNMTVMPILFTEADRIKLKIFIQIGLTVSAAILIFVIGNAVRIRLAVHQDRQKEKQFHRLHDADTLFSEFVDTIIYTSIPIVICHIFSVVVVELAMRVPELRRERRGWLFAVSFLLSLLLVFECALLGLAIYCHMTVRSSHSEVLNWYVDEFKSRSDGTIIQVQSENECCGSAGPADWPGPDQESGWSIPESCCRNKSMPCGKEGTDGTLFTRGCAEVLSSWYKKTSMSLIFLCAVLFLIDGFILILEMYLQTSISTGVVVDGLIFPSYGFIASGGLDRKKLKTMTMSTVFSSRSIATTTGQTVAKTRGGPDDAAGEVQVSVQQLIPKVRPSSVEPDIFAPKRQSMVESRISGTGMGQTTESTGGISRVTQLREKDPRSAKYRMKYFLVRELH